MADTITPEIKIAYKLYVAKQKQGHQRGWASEDMFVRDYEKYFQKDWGPNGERVKRSDWKNFNNSTTTHNTKNESTELTTDDRQRLLELAGISQVRMA